MPFVKRRKRNLILGFSASLLILLVCSFASYQSLEGLSSSLHWVQHTTEVEENLTILISQMKDVETGQRGFLLTGKENFLEPYLSGKDSSQAYYNRVRFLTQDNTQQQKTLDTLSALIKEKLQIVAYTIDDKKKGRDVDESTLARQTNHGFHQACYQYHD